MMDSHTDGKPRDSGASEAGATAIAKRAYEIWEREGRPHGRDWDHWLAAERELAGGTARGSGPAAIDEPGGPEAAQGGAKRSRARKPASQTS